MMEDPLKEPNPRQKAQIGKAKKLIQDGVRDQKDWFLKMFPTFTAQARREERQGINMLDKLPKNVRDYDSYKEMTYMKKGGSVSSASKRADGCAQRGKTKGKFV
jgi:hypothetical protein